MTSTKFSEFQTLGTRIAALAAEPVVKYARVKAELGSISHQLNTLQLTDTECSAARYMLSAVMINAAGDASDEDGLTIGMGWARELANDARTPTTLVPQAKLNQANAMSCLFKLAEDADRGRPAEGQTEDRALGFRLANLDRSRSIRALLESAAHSQILHPQPRSRALCNLANVLDDDGRWVEAYAAYSDALAADSTNGNAAGNIAELLKRRLGRRIGQRGHLAAVYNHYVRLAHELRDHTVEIAGEEVAQRWDGLQPVPTKGHFSHDGEVLDAYQQWIVEHRLALAATVEGLGSDSEHWDTATVSGVVGDMSDPNVPRIFAALNVLKAEYLVARRLAFRGISMIDESAPLQHAEDTGSYSDTADGSYYGEGPALLLLSQRSVLDVLDKIAVAANEHFICGLLPKRVNFGTFWLDARTGQERPTLPMNNPGRLHVLALAQLADDYGRGMYAQAKLLRNAGTHRLVHVTYGLATGPTEETFSSVDVDELKAATLAALWVTRAAFLYFVDLLDSQAPSQSLPAMRIQNQL